MLQALTTIPKDSCRFATVGGKSVQQGCNKVRGYSERTSPMWSAVTS
jgi:hypothetical protein